MSSTTGFSAFRRDVRLLPNVVSLVRIVLILMVGPLALTGWAVPALLIGIPAGLSDYLDGYLARKRGECTELGALLDCLADVAFNLVCLTIGASSGVWPIYLLLLWGLRDMTVTVMRASAAQQGFAIRTIFLAKVATNFYYYSFIFMAVDIGKPFSSAILTTGIHWIGLFGVHVGVILQWVSGAGYVKSYMQQYRGTPSEGGGAAAPALPPQE